jgi:hypothetical protein
VANSRSRSSSGSGRSTKAKERKPLVGSTTPRIFTPPLAPLEPRNATTEKRTLGYAVIDFAHDVLGVNLFPWQQWLLVHMLELLPDGSPRFKSVVVLVARQNGKSMLSVVLALFFMYVLGRELVVGTAQDLDVAEEIWQEAVDIVEENPELNALKLKVSKVNGKKFLELTTGERYKVKAANRRAGRGLSGDLILLDELREHQTWEAWGAITKTTTARALALVLAMSNAGDATSVVLRYLRKLAHAALGDPDGLGDPAEVLADEEEGAELLDEYDFEDDTLGIFEWSAPPGMAKTDRNGWAMANPSLGYTITERTLAAFCKTDPEWTFRTENLCQWSDTTLEGPFPPGAWESGFPARVQDDETLAEDEPLSKIRKKSPLRWGVELSHDRTRACIAVAGWRKDGSAHVEVVASRYGTDWLVAWFTERAEKYGGIEIALQTRGAPISSMHDELNAIPGVTIHRWEGAEMGRGTGAFYDAICLPGGSSIRHNRQPLLDVAAAVAVTKPSADTWLWDRTKSPADIAPLLAVNAAYWALTMIEEPPPKSAYEDYDLLVV